MCKELKGRFSQMIKDYKKNKNSQTVPKQDCLSLRNREKNFRFLCSKVTKGQILKASTKINNI